MTDALFYKCTKKKKQFQMKLRENAESWLADAELPMLTF